MKNEARLKANVLKKMIDELKGILCRIDDQGYVSVSSRGGYFTDKMPDVAKNIIRTIVEAELNNQLKKLEEEMEAL